MLYMVKSAKTPTKASQMGKQNFKFINQISILFFKIIWCATTLLVALLQPFKILA